MKCNAFWATQKKQKLVPQRWEQFINGRPPKTKYNAQTIDWFDCVCFEAD